MISKTTLIALPLALLAGAGAYHLTVVTRASSPATTQPAAHSATNALMDWLDVKGQQREQLARNDAGFADDLGRLRAEVQARRNALAASLENPQTSEQQIVSDVEAVIAADNALQRRIARYLLAVRPHLTPEQQRKLFGLCAEGIRQGHGRQWRGGRGPADTRPSDGHPGRGFRYRGGRNAREQ